MSEEANLGNSVQSKGLEKGAIFWDEDAIALASRILNRPLIRPGSDSINVPDDTELVSIVFDNLNVKTVVLNHVGSVTPEKFTVPTDSARVDLSRSIRAIELDSISLSKSEDDPKEGTMTLLCSYLGRRFSLPPIPIKLSQGTAFQKVLDFSNDQVDRQKELLQHLQSHREYYSKAVFRSLDSTTLTLILSNYSWDKKPLIDQVEPRPIQLIGNYLILRAPVEDHENSGVMSEGVPMTWKHLLKTRGIESGEQANERMIPIPTGGVFAEAVLGRSNCAEKLDITRFWNWQDSPIPLSPPDIAAVQTGSRATTENLSPGQLSSPILNIVNPTGLPNPDSMSTVLNTLSAMNFRDMSGLAGTQELAKAGAQGTLQAATDAGQLASANMKTEAQKAVSMGQIAADIAKSAIAASIANPSAAKTTGNSIQGISGDGARINQGRSMDNRGVAAKGVSDTVGSQTGSSMNKSVVGSTDSENNGDVTSGAGFSREAAYADSAAIGYSPDAVNALWNPVERAAQQSTTSQSNDSSSTEKSNTLSQKEMDAEEVAWAKENPDGHVEWFQVNMEKEDIVILWNFDVNSADAQKFEKGLQDPKFGPFLKEWSNLGDTIGVWGYSSLSGNNDSNQSLSLDRAESVKELLVKDGIIAENLIDIQGYGSQARPTNPDYKPYDAGETRAKNRAVEIRRFPKHWSNGDYDILLDEFTNLDETHLTQEQKDSKPRIISVLKLLTDTTSDDSYIDRLCFGSAFNHRGQEGYEWVYDIGEWSRNSPLIINQLRQEIELHWHPGEQISLLAERLFAWDGDIADFIRMLETETGKQSGADILYRMAMNWVSPKLKDPKSIYQYYNR